MLVQEKLISSKSDEKKKKELFVPKINKTVVLKCRLVTVTPAEGNSTRRVGEEGEKLS